MLMSSLVREPSRIHTDLLESPTGQVVTTKGCKIYFPAYYPERHLANLKDQKFVFGFFMIVVDDRFYALQSAMAMIQLNPAAISQVKLDGEPFFEMVFPPNSVVYKSLDLVRADMLTYLVFDNFWQKGKFPVFADIEDLENLFDTAEKHAGTSVGNQREIFQLITSMVTRKRGELLKSYRTSVRTQADRLTIRPDFVPLMSIRYSATNTLTKIGGSHMETGITSALISPATRSEPIEAFLR